MTNRPADAAIERHLLQILQITAAAWSVPVPARDVQACLRHARRVVQHDWHAQAFSNESGLLAQAGWCEAGDGQAASSASG